LEPEKALFNCIAIDLKIVKITLGAKPMSIPENDSGESLQKRQ
tara:strand:+ start:238 stop:366 length:129 start_codon:yes stop_codon:yes gene_type:complete